MKGGRNIIKLDNQETGYINLVVEIISILKLVQVDNRVGGFLDELHCAKSVQIRSFFWSVFSCIRTEYGDLRSKSP